MEEVKTEVQESEVQEQEITEAEKEAIKNIKYVGYKEELPLELIDPNPWNPVQMDSKEFDLLVKNIEAMGFVTTVEVRQKEGRFEIINGEHRYLALKKLGRQSIRATVFECSNNEAKIMCLMLNRIKGKFHTVKLGRLLFDLQSSFKMGELLDITGYSGNTFNSIASLMDIPEAQVMENSQTVFGSGERLETEEEKIVRFGERAKQDFDKSSLKDFSNVLFTLPMKKEEYNVLIEVLQAINKDNLTMALMELIKYYKESKDGTKS